MATKKMGRPTENPKTDRISVRFDKECVDILNRYCEKENITKVEAIRRAVKSLDNK